MLHCGYMRTFTTEFEDCTCHCCRGATSELAAGASAATGSSTSSSPAAKRRTSIQLRQLPFSEPEPRRKRHSSAPETSLSHLQGRRAIAVVLTKSMNVTHTAAILFLGHSPASICRWRKLRGFAGRRTLLLHVLLTCLPDMPRAQRNRFHRARCLCRLSDFSRRLGGSGCSQSLRSPPRTKQTEPDAFLCFLK